MRAGLLRHRIEIQSPIPGQDSYGGYDETTWTYVATVWAAIEPLKGKEYWDAQQVNAESDIRVRIRYRPGISPENRILAGSRVLNIQSVIQPLEGGREIQLLCREAV